MISAEEARRTHRPLLAGRKRAASAGAAGRRGDGPRRDGKPLDIEALTEWLAAPLRLHYLRIDPLKVDVGKVADTMSAGYAERHRVLPVQVTSGEVVVATGEPFVTDWVDEIERQSRARCAACSPTRWTSSATPPSSSRSRSVRAAAEERRTPAPASFEQLVELGKSNKQLDANDQGVVQVVDWLWQYAFDQRASDIHLEPRRERGRDPLPHRRRAAPGLPDAHRAC